MKSTSQRLILISFILAALAAAATFIYLQSLKAPRSETKKITVLVATETIPPRTLIDKKMVKEMQVDNNEIFQDYLKSYSQIVGKYTKDTISKNDGFHNENILNENSNELSFKIDKNNRAMSVNVTGDTGVSDLIKPGDFVDVLVYLPEKKDGDKVIRPDISKIILQNIEVLAVNKQLERESNTKDEVQVPTNFLITLSVPVNSLEKLDLAESIGSIKLALRPLKNDKTNNTKGATWQQLTVDQSQGKTKSNSKKKDEVKVNSNGEYTSYKVKHGDTLKKISTAFYGDPDKYTIIKDANDMGTDNLIVTGEILKIPVQN